LAADYDPLAAPPADKTLQLVNTSMMSDPLNDNLQRVYFATDLRAGLIDSIDHEANTVTLTLAAGASVYPAGTEIWFIPAHTPAHVAADPKNKHIYYFRARVKSDRIELTIREVFGDNTPIFDMYIKKGERTPHPIRRRAFPVSGL
jgi:hypothetical protein